MLLFLLHGYDLIQPFGVNTLGHAMPQKLHFLTF